MKKWLSIGLAALLCVALVGCGENAKTETKTTTAPSATASSEASITASVHTGSHTTAAISTQAMRRFINKEEALQIAAEYYDIEPGSLAPENGYEMSYFVMHPATAEEPYYTIRLQWLVMVNGAPSHQSEIDRINIDAFTGAVTSAYDET